MSAGFVKLPDALLYDPEISDGALRAYAVLAGYARACSSTTFELTGDALGTLLGRSRDQADRRLLELIARGLVMVEGNRGRARPNRITVLDPHACVFAGLHVDRASAETPKPGFRRSAEASLGRSAEAIEEGREDERGQRKRGEPLPSPVDNGGASRPPRPRCSTPGHEHAAVRAGGACAACWSEGRSSREPAF